MQTEAQKKASAKYRQKRKRIGCEVPVEYAEKVIEWSKNRGFDSLNSYFKYLIDKDMQEVEQ